MQGVEQSQRRDESVKSDESLSSSGKTVQDAIDQGLRQLNLSEDQVEVEVIKEGSRGIFGFGSEAAVVQLTPKALSTTEPEAETSTSDVSAEIADIPNDDATLVETSPEKVEKRQAESESPRLGVPGVDETTQKRAKEILETLLEKMSVEAEVVVRIGDDLVETDEVSPLTLDITGHDLGVLIGRRGETLRSLQFVVRQILSKEAGCWVPVVVDVESYLVRRRKSLKQLADRMADQVALRQRKVTLEPMSAQERRIIHLQLREHDDVYTQSIGDGEIRKVVIFPK